MKQYLALIIATIMLAGCSALDKPVGSNPFEAQPVMAKAQATSSPLPTVTPTATSSPTEISYGDLPITQTAQAVVGIGLDQKEQEITLKITEKAINDANAVASATWAAPTETKIASETQTPEAYILATSIAARSQTPAAIQNKKDQAEADGVKIKNNFLPLIYGVILLTIMAAGSMLVAYLRAGVLAKQEERKLYQGTNQPQSVNPIPWVPQDTHLGAGAWVAQELPSGVTKAKMREVARRWVEHGTFSRALVEKQHVLTDGEWDNVIEFASHPGRRYIVPRNPAVVNSGWNWEPNGVLWLKSFLDDQK
jgi:hypothetical protein